MLSQIPELPTQSPKLSPEWLLAKGLRAPYLEDPLALTGQGDVFSLYSPYCEILLKPQPMLIKALYTDKAYKPENTVMY